MSVNVHIIRAYIQIIARKLYHPDSAVHVVCSITDISLFCFRINIKADIS